jgi:hypothetical protein
VNVRLDERELFDRFATRARWSLAPGLTRRGLPGGECPDSPGGCGSQVPVVLAVGDLTVDGGDGQGVLLVTGDLHVRGGFRFRGLVIVRGRLSFSGSGGYLLGAVLAGVAELPNEPFSAQPLIQYSSCYVAMSLLGITPLRPLRSGAWMHVF